MVEFFDLMLVFGVDIVGRRRDSLMSMSLGVIF